jgi:hypothetical protein
VRRVFRADFFERVYPAVRELFFKSFDEIQNDQPLNLSDSWNFTHLQPRGTFHAPSVDRHLFEMRAPLADLDLVQFLLAIPPSARLEQRIYKKMIAYTFPAIRDIPCTNSARPINPNFTREYALMVNRYVGRKIVSPLRGLISKQPPLGREFRDVGHDFRLEPELMTHILQPLLRDAILPDSIFDRASIEKLISEHYKQSAGHEQMLGLLISLGLGLRYFRHDDYSDVPETIFRG